MLDSESQDLPTSELTRDESFRRNTYWKSCCSRTLDKRATIFFTQVAFGVLVVGFSMGQIIALDKCDPSADSGMYLSLITLVLGWFAPSPSLK
jgi:hypothetical protein